MKLGAFFTGGIVPGTVRSLKALVAGANRTLDYLNLTTLAIGGVAVTASAADINAAAGGNFTFSRAALAALGADAAGAAPIVTQTVAVTASDGAKGVALPAAAVTAGPILVINTVADANLLVYPVSGGNDQINGGAEDAAFTLGPGASAWFVPTSATQWYVDAKSGVLASAAEITRAADVSSRIVTITATGAITEALHEGKTCLLAEVGGDAAVTLTLPAATGSGGRYRFVVNVVNTSNYVFKSVAGSDLMEGALLMVTDAGDAVEAFEAGATDDTVTLNGTTTGGAAIGDWIEFEDISAVGWAVRGVLTGTGDEVTPFSDTVA